MWIGLKPLTNHLTGGGGHPFGINRREEGSQNDEGKQGYPMIMCLSGKDPSTFLLPLSIESFVGPADLVV